MNNCYASIEMLHHPKLRGHPVAVGGSVESRHGIILARNYEARPFGVKVGQALWEARRKCPDLIIVPPDYDKYLRYSRLFRGILSDYSPQVEPFGLDESWVDVSKYSGGVGGTGGVDRIGGGAGAGGVGVDRSGGGDESGAVGGGGFGCGGCVDCSGGIVSGANIADEIRRRVKEELGVTVSVGVSWNKIFAKLGSDIKKPDATTVISESNYREVVWPLPAADLLGVGGATKAKLAKYGIETIGDIANCDPGLLKGWFGKWGLFLYSYANGMDSSPVMIAGDENVIKSVGNSSTCPRDLENDEDAHIVFQNLAESVAERMRELGLQARTVEISLRRNDLSGFIRQRTLERPTHISTEICEAAMDLLRANYDWELPLRSIGVRGTNLVPICSMRQLSLFVDDARRDKAERLEHTIDTIRRRYGHYAIDRALLRLDDKLGKLNPKDEHTIHPIGYL